LALNCILKPSPAPSSTEKLLSELLDALRADDADGDIVRVAAEDSRLPGTQSRPVTIDAQVCRWLCSKT
jgi:hypothetical protein